MDITHTPEEKTVSPLRAIRRKCLDCVGSSHEVNLCPVTDCSLYPFRFGHDPYRKPRELTEEQRTALADRLAKARAGRQEL